MPSKRVRPLSIPSLIALVLMALWALFGYQGYAEHQQVVASKEAEINRLVVAVEEQTLRLFKLTEGAVVVTSQWIEGHPGVYPGQDPAFIDLVTHLRRLSDGAIELRFVDHQGGIHEVPAASDQPVGQLPPADYARVQQATQERGLYINDPLRSRITGKSVVPVSYPIRAVGSPFTIVTASIQLDSLIQPLEAQRQKPNGSIALIKGNGVTLMRVSGSEPTYGKSIAQAPDFITHLSTIARGLYRVTGAYDGVDRMVGHARLNGYPVIVAVTASVDDVLAPWWRQQGQIAFLLLLISVTAVFAAIRVKRQNDTANGRLADSLHRFRTLIEHAPDAILVFDVEAQCIIDANPSAETLFECSRQDLLGRDLVQFYTPVQPDGLPVAQSIQRAHAQALRGESVLIERTIQRASGAIHTVELRVDDLSDVGRRLLRISIIDISERKRAETRLQLAASVFTHAREGIIITDAAGTIVEVNTTFSDISGYSRAEILGEYPRMLRSGRHGPEFYAAMWKSLADNGYWCGEMSDKRKNGDHFTSMLTISAVRDGAGTTQNYVALCSDITAMKEYQHRLEHIAHFDVLTGLPNRVLLADRMQQAMLQSQRHGSSLAVAYLDLDGFKAVNDQYGHTVGDELLVNISHSMRGVLREGDTLARIGGDEFVVVLIDLEQAQDCEPVLVRLLQATADCATVDGGSMRVSASIGVTMFPQDSVDADQLLRHADQAMYLAKEAGKNRYHVFDVVQDAAVKSQRESVEHIRAALERQEFVLYYQPKVNMRTGAVIGAEALIRWQHPERGLLPPAAFLPVIEGHSLSVDLGEWVINTALHQMVQWQALGLNMQVSVNVGARQLQQFDFVARLTALLAQHPTIAPEQLELEVLETSALEDVTQVSDIMHACRALGVHFALDDFGTGYSSLTYLKRLPAGLLKIDQSFVRGMLDDPDDLAIVQGVVGLATAFRRNVIAEGVETVAHGELLLPMGCELAQGYGIARPMPAAQLPDWVATWRPDPRWARIAPLR